MERKIGETFEYGGKTLQVKEAEQHACKGCFFENKCNKAIVNPVAGNCFFNARTDKKEVVFVEVAYTSDEEPRKQDEQELNICQSLKLCPEGMDLWSPLLGKVKLFSKNECFVTVIAEDESTWDINADGTMEFGDRISIEPMLYPSREQRDWTKFQYKLPLNKMPKTWFDYLEMEGVKGEEEDWNDSELCTAVGDLLTTDEDYNRSTDRHVAMLKLHALRDFYRQGWKPAPYRQDTDEWIISNVMNEHGVFLPCAEPRDREPTVSRFLTFQDEATATEFCKNFDGLIRVAGDLI